MTSEPTTGEFDDAEVTAAHVALPNTGYATFVGEETPTKKQKYKWKGLVVHTRVKPEWKERSQKSHLAILQKYGGERLITKPLLEEVK